MTKEEYILYKYAAVDRDLALDYFENDDDALLAHRSGNGLQDRVNNEMNMRMLRDDRSRLNDEIERKQAEIASQRRAAARRNPLNWFTNMFRKKQPQPQPQPQQQQIRPEEYTPLPADAWHLGGFGM